MMKEDEEDNCDGAEHDEGNDNDDPIEAGDVSILNSLVSHGSPRSLQLWEEIEGKKVQILIDSGSTHNFVQPCVVEKLKLPIQATKVFKVYTGSDDNLICENIYANISLNMQRLKFTGDLFILPMKGADIALGI